MLEQRRFKLWDQILDQDYIDLHNHHDRHAIMLNTIEDHARLCSVHQSIFEGHRKLMEEHARMAEYCLKLLERLKVEQLTQDEITREVENLSRMYDLMRLQHMKMDRERRQVLAEHRDFLRNHPHNHGQP